MSPRRIVHAAAVNRWRTAALVLAILAVAGAVLIATRYSADSRSIAKDAQVSAQVAQQLSTAIQAERARATFRSCVETNKRYIEGEIFIDAQSAKLKTEAERDRARAQRDLALQFIGIGTPFRDCFALVKRNVSKP